MKKIILSFLSILFCLSAFGQEVMLSAPLLADRQAKLYYYQGAKVDSLLSVIDASGNVSFNIPLGDYNGMAVLIVDGAGGVNAIVAEPIVSLACNAETLSNETVDFSKSVENSFLAHIFKMHTLYMQQESWLKAGETIYPDSSMLIDLLQSELVKVKASMSTLKKEIEESKLYAARYYHLVNFINRIFEVEQKRDAEGVKQLCQDMEESLDIPTLYTSGRLWNNALRSYVSLFNRTMPENTKQQEYATSVLKTIQRLPAPSFEAYIADCITEIQRYGWGEAQDKIIGGLLTKYEGFTSSYPVIQRAIGAYHVNNNKQLPPIVGLAKTEETFNKMLVVFHDSDCVTCTNEMNRLTVLYPSLQEKKIRVISIAADTDKHKYETETKRFPWKDKLCDFKGFTGENFVNYNVIGSPSFYLIDVEGKLLGMYFNTKDLERDL